LHVLPPRGGVDSNKAIDLRFEIRDFVAPRAGAWIETITIGQWD